MGIDLLEAKVFPSYTLACTMIGYVLGILIIPKYVSQTKALIICTILGLLLSFGVVFADFNVTLFGHQANISIFLLCALGFPNALIYAGIWSFIYPRAGQVHQDRFFTTNYGTLRKCHFTIDIRLFC